MSQLRIEKIQELMKQEISKIILQELKDPRIGFVTVTQVEVTRDLSQAKVYVSLMGSEEQIRLHTKKLMKLTYLMSAIWNAIILATLPLTLKMYNISPDAYSLALKLIIIHNGCAIFIWPASFTMPNVLKAANDVKFTMCIALFSMFTFRLLLSYIIGLKLGMGAIGVWIAMIVDWVFRAVAFCLRYKGKRWLSYSIYKKGKKPAKAE